MFALFEKSDRIIQVVDGFVGLVFASTKEINASSTLGKLPHGLLPHANIGTSHDGYFSVQVDLLLENASTGVDPESFGKVVYLIPFRQVDKRRTIATTITTMSHVSMLSSKFEGDLERQSRAVPCFIRSRANVEHKT